MKGVDAYLEQVIKGGDEISARLEKIFAPTLKNSTNVEIISQGMNGIKVIRPPADHYAVVHSLSGDPALDDPRLYAHSVVHRLVRAAQAIDAKPIGFANVIDASTSDASAILPYAEGLAEQAHEYVLVVPNGEFAVLGNRVAVPANISATMVCFISKNAHLPTAKVPGFFKKNGVVYGVFDPAGNVIYMNSDGVGTKTEFYERSGRFHRAYRDSLAMKLDDLVKIGATARVVSDVAEMNAPCSEPFQSQRGGMVYPHGEELIHIVQEEIIGRRLRPYKEGALIMNLSGSAVSTIDEARLQQPLKPSAGEYLVALCGNSNPRSNGITDKRSTMIQLFGPDWHKTREGSLFMDYLGEPSTIFYGIFKELIECDLATSVYHMSGGACNGKLARPLAKHGLFIALENLFPADWRELTLSGARFTNAETAYAKWPMGNEGFVSTSKPEEVLAFLGEQNSCFLKGRIVGRLEAARNERTGVELIGIKASNGENVYYSGKE